MTNNPKATMDERRANSLHEHPDYKHAAAKGAAYDAANVIKGETK